MFNKKIITCKFNEDLKDYDLNLLDKIIGNLKRNKNQYARLVFLLAVFIPKSIFAENIDNSFSETFKMLFSLLIDFAKYGCLFMGTKRMLEQMLVGANLKEASTAAIQYYIFYILLQLYPKLFGI